MINLKIHDTLSPQNINYTEPNISRRFEGAAFLVTFTQKNNKNGI